MRCRIAVLSVAVLLLPAASCTDLRREVPRSHLVWSDEFRGASGALPSARRWGYQTGGNGWGNNELECYTNAPGNVSTDGRGHLVISAIRQPGHRCVDGAVNDYTSARITTQHKFSFERGRMEVRAKVPSGVGTWAAFWALGIDHDTAGWPRSGELDVMEQVGREPRTVLGTAHGPTGSGEHWYLNKRETLDHPASDRFHVYSLTWSKSRLTWRIDGKKYFTLSEKQVAKTGSWVFDKRFYLLLNLAIGGNLGGEVPGSTTWPQRYVIDYVRVYR